MTEKNGISNIEQGISNDEGRVETEDPRQRNREACTGGKLQGGWPTRREYRTMKTE